MKEDTKNIDQIAADAVQDLKDAVENYVRVFSDTTKGPAKFLTIDQLEDIVKVLDSETRKIYLNMVSDSLSSIKEKDIISSKKANSRKRG